MMFQLDDKKKSIVSLTLRVIVSGYIGFMGVMLIRGYVDEGIGWYLGFGIFFMVMAVAFVIFGVWFFFKQRSLQAEAQDRAPDDASEVVDGDTDATASVKSVEAADATTDDRPKRMSISDIANYKSDDEDE